MMSGVSAPLPDMTTAMLAKEKERGRSWQEIADTFQLDAGEVYKRVTDYWASNVMTDAEYRHQQLSRLEKIVDALWDMAIEHKSLDHIEVLIKTLEQTSKLLGLNKQKAITEIQVIDQRQQTLVINYLDAVTETLYQKVLSTVTDADERQAIASGWDDWVASAASEPMKMIESDTVKVDG